MYLIWSVVWSIWYYLCYKISLYSTFVKIYICMIIFNLKGKVWMVLKMPLNPQNTKNLYRYSLFYCNVVWYKVHTHTHTRLMALCPGLPGWASTKKENQSGFYWSKRQWVAMALAGPYASLHLAPDRYHTSSSPLSFFTGRMPFLPPNQQRQST